MRRDRDLSKPFWTFKKKFFAVLLIVVLLGVGYYRLHDKPAKLVQTTDFEQEVDYKAGELVDFRGVYVAKLDEAFSGPGENGWRLILQALGPRALMQDSLADQIPWEEVPTNEASQRWFNEEWTYLCEKFELDPNEKPTMLDRLDIWDYLEKNGLTGNEPEPDPEDFRCGTYWENYEKRPGRFDSSKALDFLGKPWTAAEYPPAARWLEENADLYEVLALAARSPRLVFPRKVPAVEDNWPISLLLPDVQTLRGLSRLFLIRACYRVGTGDVSGAVDDVETITLFGRALLEPEYSCFVERLTGIAILGNAFSVPLFGNPDVAPSADDLARIAKLWTPLRQSDRMERVIQSAFNCEKLFSFGTFEGLLARRRLERFAWNSTLWSIRNGWGEGSGLDVGPRSLLEKSTFWLVFSAAPFDDAKAFQYYKALINASLEDSQAVFDFLDEHGSPASALTTSPEMNLAVFALRYLLASWSAAAESHRRCECVAKISAISLALLTYQTERGTLPPAFTVDENGKPLQSWRVLILPYLGDDAKALYDQIRLDEPWDSEHNAAFHAQIPDVFRCPSASDLKEGETLYSVLLGSEGLFDDSGVGKNLKTMTDLPDRDVMRQFLVVERAAPICWMAPNKEPKIADFFAGDKVVASRFFENYRHSGGVNVSLADGSERFVATTTTNAELESFLKGLPAPPKEEQENPVAAELLRSDESDAEESAVEESTENADLETAPGEP